MLIIIIFVDISKWNYFIINVNNNLENLFEKSLSNKNSSNTNFSNSENINSSSFLNNQNDSNLNLIHKYNVEIVDCFFKDASLDEYYDNFYL